jgi:hypothetical protein
MTLEFDHLAISVEELAAGSAEIEALLGVPLQQGGEHPAMGTHNRLLSLGPQEYLEVIAINPAAAAPAHPRWFALDRFQGSPRLTNWICRSDDLDSSLKQAPAGAGSQRAFTRGDLKWRMAVPDDGELPFDNCHPALIQWDGPHPAPRLTDLGCRLNWLELRHPGASALAQALTSLDDPRIRFVRADVPGMRVGIETPEGERVIG